MIKKNKKSKLIIKSLIVTASLIALAVVITVAIYPTINNEARKQRIENIYNNLQLSDDYILSSADVFGEKRVYEWDQGRSYSSSKQYTRGADVDKTVAELKKSIEDAGFTFFGEPYPGSADTQLHFKSIDNEYIRLTVSSKPRDDNFENKRLMRIELGNSDFSMGSNAGPSNVIIKVNLDNNNE